MGPKAFLDGSFVLANKGEAASKTKRGKRTKVMLVADGNNLPISLELASVSRHEVKLAVPALQMVCAPQKRR